MLRSLLVVLLLAGCVSTPRVVVQPTTSRAFPHAQDIRFARVDIDRVPILTAVEAICGEIDKVYGTAGGRYFTWAYTAGPFPGTPEGPVTLHASDVLLGQVLDEFCRQTGWTYRWVNIGMVEFQNGPVPGYQPEIRRPRPNQSLEAQFSEAAQTRLHQPLATVAGRRIKLVLRAGLTDASAPPGGMLYNRLGRPHDHS